MKNTLLSVAVIAAVVITASADTAWFTGTIGSETGGVWTMPADGVSTNETTLVLDDPDTAAYFTASEKKSLSSSANLSFTTTAKFEYAYDELPEIDADERAGVIVYGTTYYVLEKDSTTNRWSDSGITAAALDSDVSVNVVISNGNSSAWAIYTIGGNSVTKEIVQPSAAMGVVSYSGCGEISSLVGQLIALGYDIPGSKTIATDVAQQWAQSHGYSESELAAILADTTTYTQGRTAAESCILGVGTNDTIRSVMNDDSEVAANTLRFGVECMPITGRATFQVKKDGVAYGEALTTNVLEVTLADGTYTIVAYVDGANKEIPVSKTMGVKTAANTFASASSAGFCAVPYADDDGTDIGVDYLFKKSLLVEGDQLDIFDSASAGWKTFTFNGSAWAGVEKNGVTPDPLNTWIKRGQAFKLTRPASGVTAAPVFLGYVSDQAATVSLPSKKYELVANSDGSAFNLSKAGDNDWLQKIDVNAVLPTEIYKKSGGEWKKITYSGGVPSAETVTTVEGAVFFLNRGNEAKNVEF